MEKNKKSFLNRISLVLANVVATSCGLPKGIVMVAVETLVNKTNILESLGHTIYDFYVKTDDGKTKIKYERVILTGGVIGTVIIYFFLNEDSSIKRLLFKAPLQKIIAPALPEILKDIAVSETIQKVAEISTSDTGKQLIPISTIQSVDPIQRALKYMIDTNEKQYIFPLSQNHLLLDNLTVYMFGELLKEKL